MGRFHIQKNYETRFWRFFKDNFSGTRIFILSMLRIAIFWQSIFRGLFILAHEDLQRKVVFNWEWSSRYTKTIEVTEYKQNMMVFGHEWSPSDVVFRASSTIICVELTSCFARHIIIPSDMMFHLHLNILYNFFHIYQLWLVDNIDTNIIK